MATQAERREATSEAIIAAATKLFGENGFEATRVDDIAVAAGVAKGAVYHHFPTKESVFEAVFDKTAAALATKLIEGVKRASDPLDAVVVGTRGYLEACAESEMGQIILRDGPNVLGWPRWRELDQQYFGSTIPKALAIAMDRGLIKKQALAPIARLIVGAITEAAMAGGASDNPALEARQHIRALRSLLDGLRIT